MSVESDLPRDESAVATDRGVDETRPADAAAPAEAVAEAAPSVGQQLRAGREARGMALGDVAERLKLSPRQVEALENDDWTLMQCNTITRGFIRNYARLVGLDGAALMAALDRVNKPQMNELTVPESINVKVPNEHGGDRRDYVRVIGGSLVLVLAVLAYFFMPANLIHSTYESLLARFSGEPAESATSAPGSPEGESAAPLAPPPAAPEASAPVVAPPPAEGPVAIPAGVPPTEVPASAIKSGDTLLKFSFAQSSWVEVKDRSGQVIFSQLNPAGTQREVGGQPPFSLVIGNAGGVSLRYKGKEVDLSRRSKDDVARLTLE